jgi:magnesium transporter
MLNAYCLSQGRVEPLDEYADLERLATAQWIELVAPSDEELLMVQSVCPMGLPELEDIDELEASAHYVTHEQAFQVNCLFFHQLGDEPQNTNISFVFDGERLVSVCSRELPHPRLLRIRNQRGLAPLPDALSVLLSLLEIKVDGLADEMEQVYRDLEAISRMVLGRQSSDLEEAVDGLAEQEDMIGKVRLCLMDGQRDIRFLVRQPALSKKCRKRGHDMLGDIETLLPHNAFLSEKADFLLNTAQGFINIEQNRIMKVFSIAAVVFLPPTLVAGIYGMNFHFMPELSWPWGYPMALGLLAAAGISPYLYFKLKGWL